MVTFLHVCGFMNVWISFLNILSKDFEQTVMGKRLHISGQTSKEGRQLSCKQGVARGHGRSMLTWISKQNLSLRSGLGLVYKM